jgi:DNA-binding NtrC family response regulator
VADKRRERVALQLLRQRLEDIGLLADRFMRAAAERYKKTARALPESSVELLMSYAWPGNVRELRNLVEQAVLLEKGERLEPELINRLLMERPTRTTFSSQLGTPPSPVSRFDNTPVSPLPLPTPVIPIAVGTRVEDAERQLALRTLEAYAGDRIAACAALGVDSARLDEILGGHAAQHAVPHN